MAKNKTKTHQLQKIKVKLFNIFYYEICLFNMIEKIIMGACVVNALYVNEIQENFHHPML